MNVNYCFPKGKGNSEALEKGEGLSQASFLMTCLTGEKMGAFLIPMPFFIDSTFELCKKMVVAEKFDTGRHVEVLNFLDYKNGAFCLRDGLTFEKIDKSIHQYNVDMDIILVGITVRKSIAEAAVKFLSQFNVEADVAAFVYDEDN